MELLNLEAAGVDSRRPADSGPVGFSRASVTAGGEGAGAPGVGVPASGVFGPPPVMPPPVMPPSGSVAGAGPVPLGTEAPVPGPRDAVPPPGRLAVSVTASSTRGADGRGRRLSCSVALAVAGALAAVTVGSVFVFDLLPGRGGGNGADSGDTAGRAPSATSSVSAPASGVVPERYVGTWEGEATALGGKLPAGTFRITIERVGVGQELGRLRQTDVLGGVCVDVLTLQKVTGKEITAASAGAEDNHDGCDPAPTTVHFTPVGDDLDYASESEGSGRPEARLSKVG